MSEKNVASRGDFRGDFSRDTFDPMNHFSRVLMQQGRVQLDADWNEQVSILLHYMRQLGRDLMGPHGAPSDDEGVEGKGFKIIKSQNDFKIDFGRYYVNGILCENYKENLTYFAQTPKPDGFFFIEKGNKLKDGIYLVYLDAWERHLTYVEDDSIREKALGGADTATRAQVVWQVKVTQNNNIKKDSTFKDFNSALITEKQPGAGKLKASSMKYEEDKKPCLASPESTYRGAENQLYRVEIHQGGAAGTATFKWSRENGSVIFPVTDIAGKTISLEHLGHDDRFSLQQGDWVEMLDDDIVLRNQANDIMKVAEVDRETRQVTLSGSSPVDFDSKKHPFLRRWDQKNGDGKGVAIEWKVPVNPNPDAVEKTVESKEIQIEDGIYIQFQKDQDDVVYQRGDYWLIPARTATGDVEWPKEDNGQPKALLPHGVVHHYAPLAIITVAGGNVTVDVDLRRQLNKGWS